MITKLRDERQEADSAPTDDREAVVAISEPEGDGLTEYRGDEVAEIITLPGGMVQAIDMEGERHDPVTGDIAVVSGESWSVWVKRGDKTTRYDEQTHTQKVTKSEHKSIRRAKRTNLIEN